MCAKGLFYKICFNTVFASILFLGVKIGNFLLVLFKFRIVAVNEMSRKDFLHIGLLLRVVVFRHGVVNNTFTLFLKVRVRKGIADSKDFV